MVLCFLFRWLPLLDYFSFIHILTVVLALVIIYLLLDGDRSNKQTERHLKNQINPPVNAVFDQCNPTRHQISTKGEELLLLFMNLRMGCWKVWRY